MELKLVRGFVADVAPEDKKGWVACRIGKQSVKVHRDLTAGAKADDEVVVGGELHQDVVHVYALKNLTQRKLYKVDFTFHILGGGFGVVVASFGLIFMAQSSGAFIGNQMFNLILVSIGTLIAFTAVHRIPRINRLTRWVDSVES